MVARYRIDRNPSGWSRAGELLIELGARGLIRECVSCHREFPPGPHRPYCRSSLCSDPFYERFYRAWHIAKRIAERRAGGRCQKCGRRPTPIANIRGRRWRDWERLEVDHIVEIARGGDPLDPANLQVLCSRCHYEKTRLFLASRGRGVAAAISRSQITLEACLDRLNARASPYAQRPDVTK